MKVKSVKPTKDNKDKVDEIGMTLPKRKKKRNTLEINHLMKQRVK